MNLVNAIKKTSFHTKLTILIVLITLALLTPFFIWGDAMDAYFESQEYQDWLASAKAYAWAVGIALIVADLFLPIPAPPIMAAMGAIYGAMWGGIIAAVGSILAGLVAYVLARAIGIKAARYLASDDELEKFQHFFDTWGGGGIIASRSLPVMPEVLTLLAGLAKMHFGRFFLSLLLGSVPVGFAMAWVGKKAGGSSSMILVLTLIPVTLWVVYLMFIAPRLAPKNDNKLKPATADSE